MKKVEIHGLDNKPLKDMNGKVVHLGDTLSFEGETAKVTWWEEQERFYLDFGNCRFEILFYTWLRRDFEIVED